MHERVRELRSRFDRDTLWRMERVLERYCLILRDAAEPHYLGKVEPKLTLHSNYRLHLSLHEVVLDGRAAVEAALSSPSRVVARARKTTDASLLYATGLLRWETLCIQIGVFRWSTNNFEVGGQPVPGICEFKKFLETIVPPGEDWCPSYQRSPAGEWQIESIYPAVDVG